MDKRTTALFVILALAASGCAENGDTQLRQSWTDERANDMRLLEYDPLFKQGDLGIDEQQGNGMRPLAGSALTQVYPLPGLANDLGAAVQNVIATASSYYGTPYQYGSDRSEPSTFDCSDFTRWVYLYTLGMDLPKDSRSQADYVRSFSRRKYTDLSAARPGDLLFFRQYRGICPEDYTGAGNDPVTHVGLYIGNGKMIHTASEKTGGVRIDTLAGKHFEYRFVIGGSVLEQLY